MVLAAKVTFVVVRSVRDAMALAEAGVAEIAARLVLSEGTVHNYLSTAIAKTSTRNRLEALQVADERGWL